MARRSVSIVFLGGVVLLFASVVIAAVLYYALPGPDWVSAGPAGDFPPAETPYPVRIEGAPLIFIINIKGDVLALSAKDPHPLGQVINWQPLENRFIDPLTGSNYWLDGSFDTRFLPEGPEPMDMVRFPVRIEDGMLWIDLSGIGD